MTSELARRPEVQPPMPTSFRELEEATPTSRCSHCNEQEATHAVSFSVTRLDGGRGAVEKMIRRRPVCEQCAVKMYVINARALRYAP